MKKYSLIVAMSFIAHSNVALAADGKAIFESNKCNKCHSIDSEKISKTGDEKKSPDLSGVGKDHNADWMTKFVRKEEKLNNKKHKTSYKGSDDDLKVLSTWLATLKSGKAPSELKM